MDTFPVPSVMSPFGCEVLLCDRSTWSRVECDVEFAAALALHGSSLICRYFIMGILPYPKLIIIIDISASGRLSKRRFLGRVL